MQGIIVLLVIAAVGLVVYKEYSSIQSLRKQIQNAWSSRDFLFKNQLKVVDSFVNSARYYLKGENELINQVTKISNQSKKLELSEKRLESEAELDNFLDILLRRLGQEKELRRIRSFADINNELSSIRTKLQHARSSYNQIAKIYNKKIENFPGNVIAGAIKMKKFPVDKKGRFG